MALDIKLQAHGVGLTASEEQHIRAQLAALARRLENRPDPQVEVVVRSNGSQRSVQVDLRLRLGPLGPHLVAHETAPTADQAAREAIQHVERQLERQLARQRGEPSYGVPSRRGVTRRPPAGDEEAAAD